MRKISLIWILLMLFMISSACCHQSTSSQQADGMAADITSFYEEDTQFDERQYFPGLTEVGRSNDQLIALPITIQLPYMTIAKEKWENSAFSAMPETYSVMDLLSAMNEELDKAESTDQYLVFGKERCRLT